MAMEKVVQAFLNIGKTFRAPFQEEPKLLIKADALFEIVNHNGSVINPLKVLWRIHGRIAGELRQLERMAVRVIINPSTAMPAANTPEPV